MFFLYATLTAFSVGFLITPILISFLKKFKIGDHPGGRKIHTAFVPSMGGISFMVASTVTMAIWGWQFPLPDIRYLLGAILLMFIVGLRDDLVELRASRKLLGQLVAVLLVVVVADVRIKGFHGFLGIGEFNETVSYLFSGFVLLALTNGFNLIDGLDGLAGSIAAISLSCLGGWFLIQGVESYALISFTFLGGVLAFLAFNWHPAKLFMGDTGSLTLGFTLGTLIIGFMGINEGLPKGAFLKFESTFAAGVALMMFPLYDMGRVFIRRISQGKRPMSPDKSHVHHFLMRIGLKHNQVALLLGGLQLVIIVLVFFMRDFSDNLVLPVIVGVSIILGYRLDKVTVHYIKKKVAMQPRVLEIRPIKSPHKSKIKLDKIEFKDSNVNLN
ncbi:glycosyltransferase family 4 protein [Algoriphagus yeomjeoni]|uniref:UDP-N-acetylmuramyl pentapeptide phosphotransferase/UDP-N-acetylglucosamine-1-phosphate transferase n=1 Tax=Algoriphagus yeomjeoni TaxID=291403 RepID=A0A327PJB2_9BACT|nr:MraY family glycosyltransferase [Algoriphagus yeomjeoni]RAI91653.1 UDP-N-acetylmuramyl pentapeptide phosphotransferase/UDP-N-acetylglucosamine-1-phosphate transferase [Algoriphagus yeomjeoni]